MDDPTADASPRDDRRAEGPAAGGGAGPVVAVALAWLLSVGFDLLLHGGVLRSHYVGGDPFLLEPSEAFRRIPAGYLAFLVLTVALQWLVARLDLRGAAAGARLGVAGGFVVWGALCLGLWSITPAGVGLLVGWWVGQSVELGLAGAVLGAARAGATGRRLALRVCAAVVALIVATVVLQNLP